MITTNNNNKQKESERTTRASHRRPAPRRGRRKTKSFVDEDSARLAFGTRAELDNLDDSDASQITRVKFNRLATITLTSASNMVVLGSTNVGLRISDIALCFRYYRFTDVKYRVWPQSNVDLTISWVAGVGHSTVTSISDLESLHQAHISKATTVPVTLKLGHVEGLTGRKWLFTNGSGADSSDVNTGTLMMLGTAAEDVTLQIMGTIEFMGVQDPLIAMLEREMTLSTVATATRPGIRLKS